MNLTYVKNFLRERRNHITPEDIDQLITEIGSYQGTESTFTDISKVMRVINEYNLSFLTQVEEYEAIPKDLLLKRVEKAREVLVTLSSLHTYLILSLANIKESTFNMKNIRTYMSELSEKKEHFKSEKMSWVTILKSLTQEMSYVSDMRRMDIEDKVGYWSKKNG